MLCMKATMDPDLLKLVQQHVNTLKAEVEQLTFEVEGDRDRVLQALKDITTRLEELEDRVTSVQREQDIIKQELSKRMDCLHTDVEDVQQRVARVEDKLSSATVLENQGKCIHSEALI